MSSEHTFGEQTRGRIRRRISEIFEAHIADIQGGDNTELDKYLSEHIDKKISNYNLLGWWK